MGRLLAYPSLDETPGADPAFQLPMRSNAAGALQRTGRLTRARGHCQLKRMGSWNAFVGGGV